MSVKIAMMSDFHIGKERWSQGKVFDYNACFNRLQEAAFDVLILSGDIVEPESKTEQSPNELLQVFRDTIRELVSVCKDKDAAFVFCPGNNDLELFSKVYPDASSSELCEIIQSTVGEYSSGLTRKLDVSIKSMIGHYDGSLWEMAEVGTEDFPNDKELVFQKMNAWHKNEPYSFQTPKEECDNHWNSLIAECQKAGTAPEVLVTHYIPVTGFVLSRDAQGNVNTKWAYLNAFMGSNKEDVISDLGDMGTKLVICGHTHRYNEKDVNGVKIINASGNDQPYFFNL
jgi:predicted phosphodiesterase